MKTKLLATTATLMTLAADVAHADKTVPIWEQDPHDQYDRMYKDSPVNAAAVVDQYNDKLKHEGDSGAWWAFLDRCYDNFHSAQDDHVMQVVLWALCGDDLKTLNEAKLHNDDNKENIKAWKKAGAAIEAEAKDDSGIALILKQVDTAKADWKAFEAQNHNALVLYQKLKDGVRSSKSNDKNFDGCWEATQPAFAKLVRATRFSWDSDDHVAELVGGNPTNYFTLANFGMCAYSAHLTGGVLADRVPVADRDALPDVDQLSKDLDASVQELLAAARAESP